MVSVRCMMPSRRLLMRASIGDYHIILYFKDYDEIK